MFRVTAEKLLLLLVIITIGILLFREPLLEKRWIVSPEVAGLRFELDSDVQDGGNTFVEWVNKNNLEWRCVLGEAYDYPFCGMQIYLTEHFYHGKDFSDYTHLNFWLEYEGSAHNVRIFLRNSNPAYTNPDDMRSTKFNMTELDVRREAFLNNISLAHFRVADWWLLLYEIPVEHSQVEFDNIGLIEIQTGSRAAQGEHSFKLKQLELVGVYISAEKMYLGIIVVWICAVLLYLAWRIRVLKVAVRAGKEKQAELTEINRLLDQRSRTLEEKSKLDPLTGAYNRMGIEDSLSAALRQWKYDKKPLSLLLFDVDHFKNINDTYGHGVGDKVLRELTALVNANIRAEDRFARWGGEEFIIVCSSTGLNQAADLAEKLRRIIESATMADSLKVTVSFGVAQIREGESLEVLFDRADKALYAAKAQGRNRVRIADV